MPTEKIYTLDDLKATKLPIRSSTSPASDIPAKQDYLTERVINMWDWENYSDYYTYFEDDIHHIVYYCKHHQDGAITFKPLKLVELKVLIEENSHEL